MSKHVLAWPCQRKCLFPILSLCLPPPRIYLPHTVERPKENLRFSYWSHLHHRLLLPAILGANQQSSLFLVIIIALSLLQHFLVYSKKRHLMILVLRSRKLTLQKRRQQTFYKGPKSKYFPPSTWYKLQILCLTVAGREKSTTTWGLVSTAVFIPVDFTYGFWIQIP